MAMADVTIRGAGIFGLSIAWACRMRGARVRVVDPNGPGAGSSGGLVGALAPHVPENWNDKKAFQLESLLMAETFWTDVARTGGISPGYARRGRLQPLADDRAMDLARARALGADDLWQGRAEWRVRPVSDFGDWCPASPTGLVVEDTLSARMHPRRACAALVAALGRRDVSVVPDAEDAGHVVEATGIAGLLELNDALGRTVGSAVKGQAALLRHRAGAVPQVFADGLHIVPHSDGTVAIGSTSERVFDDPGATDEQIDALVEKARAVLPALRGAEVTERWAGLRPRSKSRAPMLGAHPLRPDHFIANGGFKIGFGMAPMVAEVMADLVLDGRDRIPEGFRPEASL